MSMFSESNRRVRKSDLWICTERGVMLSLDSYDLIRFFCKSKEDGVKCIAELERPDGESRLATICTAEFGENGNELATVVRMRFIEFLRTDQMVFQYRL